CMLIAAGGATISSIFLGQHNSDRATDTVNNVFTLCLIHAAVFGGLTLLFLDEILIFFGATPETLPYAREFMQIILYGTPASFVLIGLNNVMRATGYPAKAMITALISVIVNIALCPILIFTLGLGIKGAAIATISGQSIGAIWVLWHFLSRKSFIRFNRRGKWLSRSIIERIYAIGMSPFLMNVCACIVVVFINKALLDYGAEAGNMAIGAYGIINRASMFFVMIVFGVTQGMQPILGFNYGAGQWHRVKRTLYMGIWIGVGINTLGWIMAELFPSVISNLFTIDEGLTAIADRGLRIFFIFYPLVGCQIVIQNFFQSIGKPRISIFLSLTRQLIFLLPLLFILPRHWGIDGVWA
ncbi:MAG: MATE family efflux transporter, partial [Paramuribaculum sp.]|nr:MATE family efflux transporter [Paramuribaculum sp.]